MSKVQSVSKGYVTVKMAAQILKMPAREIYDLLHKDELQGRKRYQGIVPFWEVNLFSIASYSCK